MNSLQKEMFDQMDDKSLFDQAKTYAFEYANGAFERNVYPTNGALENLKFFDEDLPAESADADKVLEQLHKYGSPATVTGIGGRYFGFVTGGIIPVALASKWLTDFWDQNSGLHVLSPITSKLESISEKWLKQLFNLPDETVAGYVSGTSMATFSGLAAARYRLLQRLNWDVNDKGLFDAPKLRIITGKQAHGTVFKALAMLGFGKDNIEWVDVDNEGRMIAKKLPELDDTCILIIQAGNVNSGSFDPFEEICAKANKANAWVHVDGAFGLWAAASKKLNYLTKGIEKAQSWSVDGHKTLNTPYDCGVILCADKEALVSALHTKGSYIQYSEERDGMLFTPEMSRRARALELWAALKYLGRTGIKTMIDGFYERATQFANELKKEGFTILNEVVFNQVMVSCGPDDLTNQTLKQIQQSGDCWCGGAMWKDHPVIRISVCSWATTSADVTKSVKAFVSAREIAKNSIAVKIYKAI
jgi:glutamate/tyrosine decarboxylase-like PLP-dependent enzyme